VSFKIYWDRDVGEEPWPEWVDASINYLGQHEAPQEGDELENPPDEGAVVLIATNPFNRKDRCRITLVGGEETEENMPVLLVVRITKG
jgi:hypothetical protein